MLYIKSEYRIKNLDNNSILKFFSYLKEKNISIIKIAKDIEIIAASK